MLYMGWIQSQIFCNGLVVLPTITQTEQNTLRTSLNAGIRAIVGLPKYGFADISAIRSKLNIPSIEAITEYSLQWAAWKKFHGSSFDPVGMSTRPKTNCFCIPIRGATVEKCTTPCWLWPGSHWQQKAKTNLVLHYGFKTRSTWQNVHNSVSSCLN